MKAEVRIRKALNDAVEDLKNEQQPSSMMPWEIHRECFHLAGITACIKTLEWVLANEDK